MLVGNVSLVISISLTTLFLCTLQIILIKFMKKKQQSLVGQILFLLAILYWNLLSGNLKVNFLIIKITKILSWNVRGVACMGFIQRVRNLVNLYHPEILFFMVPKVNSNKARMIIEKLNIE